MLQKLAQFESADHALGTLDATGVCSTGVREGWAIGRWHLDDTALEFTTLGERRHVRVPLADIRRLDSSMRKFVIVNKPVLIISYLRRDTSRLRRVWLLTGDLPEWESGLIAKAASLRTAPGVDHLRTVLSLTRELGAAAASTTEIIDLLASGSPATSATLAAMLRLDEDDSITLSSAVSAEFAAIDRALGAPAVRYERRRFEPATGTVHSMSWWLDREVATAWLMLRTPLEIQVDEAQLVVIMSVPTRSVAPSLSVHVDADGCGLLLDELGGYSRYVELPEAVHGDVSVEVHSNGTVVIIARRRLDEDSSSLDRTDVR